MKIIRLKNGFLAKGSLLLLILIAFGLGSCKSKDNEQKKMKEEFIEAKEELSDIIKKEKNDLKTKADSLIGNFNKKLQNYENNIENKKTNIKQETLERIKNIRAERDTISMKIDIIESLTENEWKEFKSELEHDIVQFNNSIKDFFIENIEE